MARAVVSQVLQCSFVQADNNRPCESSSRRIQALLDVQKEEQEWWFEVVILARGVGPAEAGREVYRARQDNFSVEIGGVRVRFAQASAAVWSKRDSPAAQTELRGLGCAFLGCSIQAHRISDLLLD